MKHAFEADFHKPLTGWLTFRRPGNQAARALARYSLTLAAIFACHYGRTALLASLEDRLPFLMFAPAIALCALLGGGGCGLLATALSAGLADYYWLAPIGSFSISNYGDRIGLVVFVISGLIISFTADRLARAQSHARSLDATRRQEIEQQVLERTQQLALASTALSREFAERIAAEERFRRVIETFPTAMVIVGENGLIELANQEAERLFGYARAEIVGQSIDMLMQDEARLRHADSPAAFFAEARRRPMGRGRDVEGLRKDGSVVPLEVVLGPLDFPDGAKIIASIADISRRREFERALSESAQLMGLMFDSIRDYAITMVDPGGRIINWNASAERLLGFSRDEVLGRSFELFFTPEDLAAGEPQRELYIAARDGHSESERCRVRRDGSRFLAHMTLNAVYDAAGALRGCVR